MSFRHFRLRTSEVRHLDGGVLGMNVMNHWLESPSELCTFERITEPVARYRRSVSVCGRKRSACVLDILARASRHIRSHKVKGLSCSSLQTISTTTSRASSPGTTAAHRLSACARTSPPTRSSWPDGEYTLCVQTPQTTLPLHATCVVVCTRIAAHTQHGPQRLWLQRAGRQQAAALSDTLPQRLADE